MNHGHDVGGHDMSAMSTTNATNDSSFCSGSGRVMFSGFTTGFDDDCILFLFQNAVVDSATRYAFAVIGSFFLSFTAEFLRWFRGHVANKNFTFATNMSTLSIDLFLAISFMVQMLDGYWIMLLVMLYEYIIFIFLLLGLGVGNFVFRRIDRKYFPECCATGKTVVAGTPCNCAGTNV
eukprot:m.23709 g.23709  ORF g.23709 m.23709 type:complete len:178 (+) comp13224_c0_seq1:90-623(+)